MYSEVLIAKYSGSRMNEACTVCPADFASLSAKVILPTTFFLKKRAIFVWLWCQPLAGQQHMVSGLRLLMFTNLKQINSNCYYQRLVEG